jgi:hypothetical protein
VANPNGEAATRRRGAVTSHGPVTWFPTMVARRPTSGLPLMGARRLVSDTLQWRWLTTCNVIPRGGEDLRCGSRDGVVAGGGQWAVGFGGLRRLAASPMGGEGGGRASQISDLGGDGLLMGGGLRSRPCSD